MKTENFLDKINLLGGAQFLEPDEFNQLDPNDEFAAYDLEGNEIPLSEVGL